jgi:hypothetical protein
VKTVTRKKNQARRQDAVNMRVAGYSPEEITDTLGYVTPDAASNDIYSALSGIIPLADRSLEALREIHCRRMDMMLKALMPGIERGNNRSVEVAIRILERQAKMLGLDSATQLQVLTVDAIDAKIAELTAKMSSELGA